MSAHPIPTPNQLPGRPDDVGDYTYAFFNHLEKMVVDGGVALSLIGGNIKIELYDCGEITIVTSGPSAGIYYETIDVPVHMSMRCEEWFINSLFNPEIEDEFDMEDAATGAGLEMDGNPKLLQKLLKLGGSKKNNLSIRMSF